MKKISTVFLIILAFGGSMATFAAEPSREYQLKAAFLYRFLLFAEWPQDTSVKSEDSITIGILGTDPFGDDAFEPVEGELVNGRKLVIKRFEDNTPVELLKQCDLLFISSSLENEFESVLESLDDHPVLTVSEIAGFIESGGMINLVKQKDTVKFEVNMSAAERVGIKFRSKLLRVAVRIVENQDDERSKTQQN